MKNRGYTLIEVLVVVAMILVAGTIVFMSINAIFALDMRQTAKEVYAGISKLKVDTMSKTGDVCLHLYTKSDGIYMDIWEKGAALSTAVLLQETDDLGSVNKVGKKTVSVFYTTSNNTALEIPLDNTGVVLAFNRSNGSFKTLGQSWSLAQTLFSATYTPPNESDTVTSIIFQSSGTRKTLTFSADTGKFVFS
ncbi:type II secretion system protein [Oscillospiraceae bacterium WX1]